MATGAFPERPNYPFAGALPTNASLYAEPSDPMMASTVPLGGVENAMLAQFEFKEVEFAKPTRMVRTSLLRGRLHSGHIASMCLPTHRGALTAKSMLITCCDVPQCQWCRLQPQHSRR